MNRIEHRKLVLARNQVAMALAELQAVEANLVKQFNRMSADPTTLADAGEVEEMANTLQERNGALQEWLAAADKVV